MGFRATVGSTLESAIGPERTKALRSAERRSRVALARRLAPSVVRPTTTAAARPASRWGKPDPHVEHPTPTMTRHQLLSGLHETLQPRTYLEVGVFTGLSLALSRCPSIGVDPEFHVEKEICCDVQLVRTTSDDFFARENPLEHFHGQPVDLAFIDGMHLSEFALRDFINAERLMAPAGVVVFDDVLPRNALEAARRRKTRYWAGDVYKAVEVIQRLREDVVVLHVNTSPTGTAVIVGLDPTSTVLAEHFDEELAYLTRADPQRPPQEYLDRSISVEPQALFASPAWAELVRLREHPDDLSGVVKGLRDLQR